MNYLYERAPGEENRLREEDRAVHDWYRFVLSFPPHLVREYIESFRLGPGSIVLDPFCGTGTTLVECMKHGITSIGIESNPMAFFASRIKVNWTIDPDGLLHHARTIAELTSEKLAQSGIHDLDLPLFRTRTDPSLKLLTLSDDSAKLLLKNSISPLPLHKTLVLLNALNENDDQTIGGHERLALAKTVVFGASNLSFGPEVGVGRPKQDAPVARMWLDNVQAVARDLQTWQPHCRARAFVHQADSRHLTTILKPASVDAVITSPPYPNEKDYTRTTRLESVILGFIHNRGDLREVKQNLIRSNTRSVYKKDSDDLLVADHAEIQRIAAAIESRRIELGKTSGFERLYSRVTKLYFGGMARHLAELRSVLRPGAQLAYVVGDQASYLQVLIRTGELLADIAQRLGYEVKGIDLFRTRLATATKQQLREEVVLLKWRGMER
jgi:DNA modification methylase